MTITTIILILNRKFETRGCLTLSDILTTPEGIWIHHYEVNLFTCVDVYVWHTFSCLLSQYRQNLAESASSSHLLLVNSQHLGWFHSRNGRIDIYEWMALFRANNRSTYLLPSLQKPCFAKSHILVRKNALDDLTCVKTVPMTAISLSRMNGTA